MRVTHPEELFGLELPPGWQWQAEEEGGGAIAPGGEGILYVTVQAVEERSQLPSLRRMLAGWLTRQVRPVATDELVPTAFPGAQGYAWQYVEEYADQEKRAFRVWVAGNEVAWAFLSFIGPFEREPEIRADVDRLVASFTLKNVP